MRIKLHVENVQQFFPEMFSVFGCGGFADESHPSQPQTSCSGSGPDPPQSEPEKRGGENECRSVSQVSEPLLSKESGDKSSITEEDDGESDHFLTSSDYTSDLSVENLRE
ncbi:unnamed protein product [Pleuronectes platessa]|uniref:Uncharacterized protein n=1 Tax=Pleuronectes platessa TaxID=8262 RepID=A0A9N7UGH2_PLEPL|nr:unnamed protein product [Pleuronectes platessa]